MSPSGFKRYFFNTSWLVAGQVGSLAMQLVVGILVARYLGPMRYGSLSYALSFVAILTPVTTFGVSDILERELTKSDHPANELLGTAWVLRLAGSILASLLVFSLLHAFKTNNDEVVLIEIIVVGFFPSTVTVLQSYFQARVQARYYAQALLGQIAISSAFKLVLIALHASVIWFAVVALSDQITLALALLVLYRTRGPKIGSWRVRRALLFTLLRDSWPLLLTGLAIATYMRVDQVMINAYLGSREVGYFAAAVRVSEGWYFIPMAVVTSVFPALVTSRQRGSSVYYQRLQWLYDFMVWTAVVVALPVSILAEKLTVALYGPAYRAAGGVLAIHMWAAIFVFLGVATSKWLVAENFVRKSFYRSLSGIFMNVVLNLYLIPALGIKGAAIATLISQATVNFFCDFFDPDMRYQLKIKLRAFFPIHLVSGSYP